MGTRRKTARLGALLLGALVLGCAAGGSQLRREALSSTRRVAIVGFGGATRFGAPQVRESLWEAVVKPGATALERQALQERRAEQAAASYEALRAQLTEGLGWEVLSREEVSGIVSSSGQPPSAADDDALILSGLLATRTLNQLSPAERAIFAHRLGVDALLGVEVEVRAVDPGGFQIAGFGNLTHHLQALTSIKLFDAAGELFWMEREVRGTRTVGSRSATAPHMSGESALIRESVQTSLEALVTRLATAR